jgi:hypothetical protein
MEKLPESPYQLVGVIAMTLAGLVYFLLRIQKMKAEDRANTVKEVKLSDTHEARITELDRRVGILERWHDIMKDREEREKN